MCQIIRLDLLFHAPATLKPLSRNHLLGVCGIIAVLDNPKPLFSEKKLALHK